MGGYRRALLYAEDYDLFVRISEQFECANLNEVGVQYRLHAQQLSLRTRRQQTVAKLAAQAAATARRTRGVDPLDAVPEISEPLLLEMGVTPAQLQAELFRGYQDWIKNMFLAGEYAVALTTARDVLASDSTGVDQKQIADLRLMVGRLYWKQKKYFRGLAAACQALVVEPGLGQDLLRRFLRRFGFA